MLRYIARQPILNTKEQTFGYELLYRAAPEDFARISNPDDAARSVVDDLLTLGLDELGGGRQLFLNCTHQLLTHRLVELLPPEKVVLEVLEHVVPDYDLMRSCVELRSAGYKLALDDFVPSPTTLPLVPYVQYIKLDFQALAMEQCRAVITDFGHAIEFVAEKVETRGKYAEARAIGCSLFQGYFFAKPALLTLRQIPTVYTNYLRLLAATCHEEFAFNEVEEIIKSDVGLSYKLLRFLNSAAFAVRSNITSLRQALVLLGAYAIRRWVAVSATATAAEGKPPELFNAALMRARFCELLAPAGHCNSYHAFLMGLFSCMEAVLEVPLQQVLLHVEVPGDVQSALLHNEGKLHALFELVCAYLGGEAESFAANPLGISEEQITERYLEALHWVDALTLSSAVTD